MKRPVLVGVAAAAALALYPAAASAARVTGVVVGKSPARHTLAVASTHGIVRTVHVQRVTAPVGTRVAVVAKRLPDGSFRASSVTVRGTAATAKIHGTVVSVKAGTLVLSAGGTRFTIQRGRLTSGVRSDTGPQAGDVVDATVSIEDDGTLDEVEVEDVSEPADTETEDQPSQPDDQGEPTPPPTTTTDPAPPAPQAGDDQQGDDDQAEPDDQGEDQDGQEVEDGGQQKGSDDGQESSEGGQHQSGGDGGSVSGDDGSDGPGGD